jgi:hypothetical protein
MITLTFQPLRTEGRVLVPAGQPVVVETDYLHLGRAIVEASGERGLCVHRRSRDLCQCVAGETAPAEVVYSVGGEQLLGVWRGGQS